MSSSTFNARVHCLPDVRYATQTRPSLVRYTLLCLAMSIVGHVMWSGANQTLPSWPASSMVLLQTTVMPSFESTAIKKTTTSKSKPVGETASDPSLKKSSKTSTITPSSQPATDKKSSTLVKKAASKPRELTHKQAKVNTDARSKVVGPKGVPSNTKTKRRAQPVKVSRQSIHSKPTLELPNDAVIVLPDAKKGTKKDSTKKPSVSDEVKAVTPTKKKRRKKTVGEKVPRMF